VLNDTINNIIESGVITYKSCEALEQVTQRSCGWPLPGSVQGQTGWGLGHPGLEEGVPAHSRRGSELDDL